MKKAILVVLMALLYANPSVAQIDSLNREIGFSTQIIFDNIFQSSGSPVELMLKKRTGENKWMRYGLGVSANGHNFLNPDNYDEKQYNNHISLTPSVGLEKRTALSEKWSILYGGDINLNFYYRKALSTQFDEYHQNTGEQTDKQYNAGAGIRPLIGLVYNITPRLYLSTEGSANLGAYMIRRKTEFNSSSRSSESETKTWGYNLYFRPASAIFVYYRF